MPCKVHKWRAPRFDNRHTVADASGSPAKL
jgi:hypothetical protein